MRDAARDLFVGMVADCGPTIHSMQSSCEMYLSQYLADYPDERAVLAAALRHGVPARVLEYADPTGYDQHLILVSDQLAAAASLDPADADWAVVSWAEAVGRPPGCEVAPPPKEGAGRVYAEGPPPEFVKQAHAAMTLIVVGMAFAGAFLAFMCVPVVMWAMDATVAVEGGEPLSMSEKKGSTALVFLVCAAIGTGLGLLSAVSALAGWLFAGGDNNPWATGGVACGTAFVTVAVAAFAPFGVLVKPFAVIGCVFAATYKSAARGGNY